MKKILRPILLAAALLLPSCVPSLNPLYTENDLVFDPALIGTWGEDTGKESWAFEKSGDKKYKLRQTDEHGRVAEFEAHLVKLKEQRFLDLFLVDPGADTEWKMNQHAAFGIILRPAHMFMKVRQIEPALQLAYLDPDWLKKYLEKNPKALRHEEVWNPSSDRNDKQILLTAETKDLQKFILQHAGEAFGKDDDDGLIRKEQAKPATPGVRPKP